MSQDCLFCKIVAGQLPCSKVYEDADTLAFLDIGPIVKGHTLVIPKAHHDPLTGTPVEVLQRLIAVVQKVARAQVTALKADGVNVAQANGRAAGQLVPHIHFHVIPRFEADGHHWNWVAKKYEGAGEMAEFAARIVAGVR
jgi:histidine triad (HIT) family protein